MDDLIRRLRTPMNGVSVQQVFRERAEAAEALQVTLSRAVAAEKMRDYNSEVIDQRNSMLAKAEAEAERLREALVKIANAPSEMTWGKDSEVRHTMNTMEAPASDVAAEAIAGAYDGTLIASEIDDLYTDATRAALESIRKQERERVLKIILDEVGYSEEMLGEACKAALNRKGGE